MTALTVDTTTRKAQSTLAKVAEASTVLATIIDSSEYMVHSFLLQEVAMKEATPTLDPAETPMLFAYKSLKSLTWLEAGLQIRARDKQIRTALARDLVATYHEIQESRS